MHYICIRTPKMSKILPKILNTIFLIKFLLSILTLHTTEGYIEEYMNNQNISTENWTTCDEFLNGTTFVADSVLDVDWMIFYFWSSHPERSYHIRYSAPSPMLIDRFRIELNDDIKPAVNWSMAELFVETSIDLSGLFVKTDVSGKFRFVPSMTFQFHFAPYLEFALMVVDGYLGMMNCQQKLAYALAPVEKVPKPLQIESVAGLFGIQNPLGRSYLTKSKYDPPEVPLQTVDDEADESREEWRGPSLTHDLIF